MTGIIIFTVGLMVGGAFGFAVAALLQASGREESRYSLVERGEAYGNEKTDIQRNPNPRP